MSSSQPGKTESTNHLAQMQHMDRGRFQCG
jgi:hypothetical protein